MRPLARRRVQNPLKALPAGALATALIAGSPTWAQDVMITNRPLSDADIPGAQQAVPTSAGAATRGLPARPVRKQNPLPASSGRQQAPRPSLIASGSWAGTRPPWDKSYRGESAAATSQPLGRSIAMAATPSSGRFLALPRSDGLGLIATVKDHAVDVVSPTQMINGPSGSLFDEAAGLGWRRDNLSAMIGYMRPDDQRPDYRDESVSYHKPRARVGLGLSLHY